MKYPYVALMKCHKDYEGLFTNSHTLTPDKQTHHIN